MALHKPVPVHIALPVWTDLSSLLQQALEDEVSEFLGRRRYERSGETVAHRHG